MTLQENEFLKLALDYKDQYYKTKWWKLKKRRELKKSWQSALECMVRYGK